tara:strand:- start:3042 stop:3473 length:432 start_codon:yes stop_codon:yes gene_type:complete
MDGKHYICKYCYQDFVPTRRHVQKYCSNSCRSKAHHIKNRNSVTRSIEQSPTLEAKKGDKMTMAGIGNATAGSLAADAVKSILTVPDNRPATKGDIKMLFTKMKRYHRVLNLPFGTNSSVPHFDMETKNIVYLENTLLAKMRK